MKIQSSEDVSNIIKERRKQVNISQRALMKKSSIAHSTISRVEKGETDIVLGSLLQILDALDLEMEIDIEKKE